MRSTMRWAVFVCAALALPSAHAAADPAGDSCAVANAKPCVIDLHGTGAPRFSAACTTDPWSRYVRRVLPEQALDVDGNGWFETVVEVALDPERACGCARFRIHYAKPVGGWTVDLGDSPTSDGYGGDAGTTFNEAELQILDREVFVYSASRGLGTPGVQRLLDTVLPTVAGRFVDIEVCDQLVLLEAPGGLSSNETFRVKLSTASLGALFSFFRAEGATSKDRGLYAGFNRVVYQPPGAQRRVGTGVRRVEIRLSR